MFNRGAYENSGPDGIGVLEVRDGEEAGKGEPRLFVPLKRTELRGEVAGPLASLHLVQVFGYTKEQMDKVLEAVYRFPLPGDAAVEEAPGSVAPPGIDPRWLEGREAVEGRSTAYICRGTQCSLPVTNPDDLEKLEERA